MQLPDRYSDWRDTARELLACAWWRTEYRQPVLAACGIIVLWILFGCAPLRGGRPLVDLVSPAARISSELLDALGVVHCPPLDELVLRLPSGEIFIEDIVSTGLLACVMVSMCLVWSRIREHVLWVFFIACLLALVVVWLSNIVLFTAVVWLQSVTGVSMTSGVCWFAAIFVKWLIASSATIVTLDGIDQLQFVSRRWLAWRRSERFQITHQLSSRWLQRTRWAVVATLGCGSLMWLCGHAQTDESRITVYRDVSSASLSTRDYDTATVAVERLIQLDADAPPHRFLQARICESQGDAETAERIVRGIIDDGGRPFEPAHRWLDDLLARRRVSLAGSSVGSCTAPDEQQRIRDSGQPGIHAHLRLAESYLARRSPAQAVKQLELIVDQRPELRLTLARLSLLAGRPDAARLHAELARSFYHDVVDATPVALEPRIHLAACHLFLEEFQAAITVLLKGWELTRDEDYHVALSDAYFVWQDVAARQGAPAAQQLSLLEKSLQYDARNAESLRRVATLATKERHTGPAIDLLTEALSDQPIPASVHVILGTNAYQHGRIANARRHLEEAHRLDPESVETLNNLAWVLAESDPPQLERAIKLAGEAVRRQPQLPSIRETRGQIFARMGKWSQAVADLENALQSMRGKPEIHATLAEAYDQLGDSGLAAEHRRLASESRVRR